MVGCVSVETLQCLPLQKQGEGFDRNHDNNTTASLSASLPRLAQERDRMKRQLDSFLEISASERRTITSKFSEFRRDLDSNERTALVEFDNHVSCSRKILEMQLEALEVTRCQRVVAIQSSCTSPCVNVNGLLSPLPHVDFVNSGLEILGDILRVICTGVTVVEGEANFEAVNQRLDSIAEAASNACDNACQRINCMKRLLFENEQERRAQEVRLRMWQPLDAGAPPAEFRNRLVFSTQLDCVKNPDWFGVSMSISPNGKLAAITGYNDVTIFSLPSGSEFHKFGCCGSGIGHLDYCGKICFSASGNHILVAERKNDRIQEFSLEGEHVRYIGECAFRGTRNTGDQLTGVDANVSVVVACKSCYVFVFDYCSGDLVAKFGGPDKLIGSKAVRLTNDGLCVAVADMATHSLLVFTLKGECKFVRRFGYDHDAYGPMDVYYRPSGDTLVLSSTAAYLMTADMLTRTSNVTLQCLTACVARNMVCLVKLSKCQSQFTLEFYE